MSSIIQIKNTAISGSTPANLTPGELAINVTDGRLFYGSGSANFVKEFTGSGGGGGGTINTGSLLTTASFNAWTGSSTSSFAGTASFASNGGVTSLIAGSGIILSPTNGKGNVTINSTGGSSFNTATGSYGSFYDTTTQTNPVANIPRSMSLNTTDISNGVSISGSTNPFNTYIKIQNAGVYNIQFSAQVDKTDSGTDEVVIWLRKNGTDLTDTATTLTLTGNNDKQVAAWNWFVNSSANDYYQIIWRSLDTDLRLLAEVSSSTHPGIPSVIVTANRVDQFLSNTGSFSGSFTGQFTGSLFGTSSFASTASFLNSTTNAFIQNGNSFGATAVLGTNDNQSLALETSGSTRMFISSSGNVGIGTSTPFSGGTSLPVGLDIGIWNSAGDEGNLSVRGFSSLGGTTRSSYGAVGSNYYMDTSSAIKRRFADSVSLIDFSAGGFLFRNAGNAASNSTISLTELMRITSTGNVGISTTTPAARLDVSGSVNISGSGVQVPFQITSGSTSILFVSQSGFVGIGNATPTYALDVTSPTGATAARFFGAGGTATVAIGANGALVSQASQFRVQSNGAIPLTLGSYGTYGDLWIINGNTGIGYGTTAPTLSSRFSIRGSGATSATTTFRVENSNASASLVVNDAGNVLFGTSGTGLLWDNVNTGLTLGGTTLDSNIILQINGSKGVRISGSAAGFGYSLVRGSETAAFANNGSAAGLSSTNTLLFTTAATERMRITSTGNVGIATTSPSATLDVSGSARITNGLVITGSLIVSGSGTQGSINTVDRLLSYQGTTSIDWRTRILNNGAGVTTVDWDNNALTDTLTNPSIDWENRMLWDATGGAESIDYGTRKLYNSTGSVLLDYETGVLTGTASYATQALSASYAPGTPAFPFVGSAQITGSLLLSGSLTLSNYTNSGSFPGTGSALLAVNNSGSVITSPFLNVAEQVYTGTIAWTGTAAPSGSTTHTYRWSQIGKTVNLNITLVYTGPGNAVSTVTTALPADCPTPYVPSGQSGASALISVVSAHLTTTTTIGANAARGGLRINPTNNGYELTATAAASGYKVLVTSVQYFAV